MVFNLNLSRKIFFINDLFFQFYNFVDEIGEDDDEAKSSVLIGEKCATLKKILRELEGEKQADLKEQ